MLMHPVALVAILVLVVNDHYLKAAYPGWWTGKLSDVAGLVFFPCFLQALWDLVSRALHRPPGSANRVLLIASLATALVFGAIQLWEPASDAYRYGLAAMQYPFFAARAWASGETWPALVPVHLVPDPSDLIALPAALVALGIQRRRERQMAWGSLARGPR